MELPTAPVSFPGYGRPRINPCQARRRESCDVFCMTYRPPSFLATTLWRIETSLSEPLDLARLASEAGVSGPHLVRAFREVVGLPPIAFVRARRLSEAARALAGGAPDILDLALASGYGSHEAFSRAFQSHFGCSPRDARSPEFRTRIQTRIMEPRMIDTTALPTLDTPEIRNRDTLEIVGLADRFDFESIPRIPALWASLAGREAEIEGAEPHIAYGASYDQGETGFRYIAGYPVAPGSAIPRGMVRVTAPAGRYAVWVHDGPVGDMHKTMRAIFETGLRDAGLTFRPAPELERYDNSFDPRTGAGRVELWIPIV